MGGDEEPSGVAKNSVLGLGLKLALGVMVALGLMVELGLMVGVATGVMLGSRLALGLGLMDTLALGLMETLTLGLMETLTLGLMEVLTAGVTVGVGLSSDWRICSSSSSRALTPPFSVCGACRETGRKYRGDAGGTKWKRRRTMSRRAQMRGRRRMACVGKVLGLSPCARRRLRHLAQMVLRRRYDRELGKRSVEMRWRGWRVDAD